MVVGRLTKLTYYISPIPFDRAAYLSEEEAVDDGIHAVVEKSSMHYKVVEHE